MKTIARHYRSIFISDCHFGYSISRADLLANFLKYHTCENLFLVGDIVDFWVLEKKWHWPIDDAYAVVEIFKKIQNGTRVVYITGNHDDIIRAHINDIHIDGIEFLNELPYMSIMGKRYLIIHGDLFDNEQPVWDVLSHLGNNAYLISLHINKFVNRLRAYFKMPPWSLSLYLKQNIKGAVNFIIKFEDHMTEYCRRGGYDGAICGHIHSAGIRKIGELDYMNCGDWVESCTALVENIEGSFEIVTWNQMV